MPFIGLSFKSRDFTHSFKALSLNLNTTIWWKFKLIPLRHLQKFVYGITYAKKTKHTNRKLTKDIYEIDYNRVILSALEDISYFHSLFEFQLYNVYYNPL